MAKGYLILKGISDSEKKLSQSASLTKQGWMQWEERHELKTDTDHLVNAYTRESCALTLLWVCNAARLLVNLILTKR